MRAGSRMSRPKNSTTNIVQPSSVRARICSQHCSGVPLTFSYAALLLGDDPTTWVRKLQPLIPIAGVVASSAVATMFWDRIPVMRFVPC